MSMVQDIILILDFGGQYCHLISRRIRENNVRSEIVPHDISLKDLQELSLKFNIKGIILSGGPASIYEKNSPRFNKTILKLDIPILGICYGHQLIAHYAGGIVIPAKTKEYGSSVARIRKHEDIFSGLKDNEQVWMSHGDTVLKIPKDYTIIADTTDCPIAAYKSRSKHIYGLQWHPEVTHTKNGSKILKNFIFGICNARPDWKVDALVKTYIKNIKTTVGNKKAIIALSGGIDSTTATSLAAVALHKNLIAVFVDHGFMRDGEPEKIDAIAKNLGIKYMHINAKGRFLEKIKKIINPETKRKIIGREFIKVFEEIAKKVDADYLIQGTIYPDRIESGQSKKSEIIKTHHNVGGMPSKIKFRGLVEPLKELYKDEVRELAVKLGLREDIIYRQPFPGPGLAVRIIGTVTPKKLAILKRADSIVTSEIEDNLKERPWQYFAVLTDTKSTGVRGDGRSYGYVIAIRIVESDEAMAAAFSKVPYTILERISTKITNEIPEVVRVVYDITNKPPSTIEWE
ncbi:MAG: glutamine-hydrolyzing GMP synthase [Candidatus Micrarchaeota archaeon]|nr:glutamine-hydrolyzing GMP synthase [Candidatus Micrarchaeota archaeon]